ncbi:response regulator transcription factor [Actomonas aquatica]|uniref:Response regulator transcription factor n=1 Tax=Actomonas aquatica TaxID=2866162 RepID=A0ABZ1C3J3_9BACT|nr:response regulator transcription factor [Opitutus sp. WL0086]WRQ86170.1 response regulator transcription factor [Opitutus sp. WL0086]
MSQAAKILLIEDHSMVRQMMAHLVREDLGHELVADCTSVTEGTAAVREHKPDLVIADWMLPDGRGFEVLRETGPKLPRTRWLFVSSNEQGHLVREAVRLGVQGFVMKRSDLSTLRTAITRVLAGETYYCPTASALLVGNMVGEGQSSAANLSPREQVVLRGFASGENPKAMADRLGVSAKTVQNVLSTIKDKLGLFEPAQLVHYAIRHGYIEAP